MGVPPTDGALRRQHGREAHATRDACDPTATSAHARGFETGFLSNPCLASAPSMLRLVRQFIADDRAMRTPPGLMSTHRPRGAWPRWIERVLIGAAMLF